MLVCVLAAMWIAGSYTPPAESNVPAFFQDAPNDVLEKAFPLRSVELKRAVWRIAAPGMRDLYVNGTRISPTSLSPWTPFDRRVLEEEFDVAPMLKRGEKNVLRIELGNGWFNPLPLPMWYSVDIRKAVAVGTPCARAVLELEYADGKVEKVETDLSWKASEGRVLKNSVYLGVKEDARRKLAFDRPARQVKGPRGRLIPAKGFPKTIVYDSWLAKSVVALTGGVWVVDMGVNFAGTFRVKLRNVKDGQVVRFRMGELKNPDGSVNVMSAVAGQIKDRERGPLFDVAEERDTIICRTAKELCFEPRLTYHVFRYVQVEGLSDAPRPEDFEALAWSADVKDRTGFSCSNERLNLLHEVCRRTFRANMQSVQSDCPGREKFGYGGDMACTADAFWGNYDMREFYRKAVRDFIDEAAGDGWITETAPYVGLGSNSVKPRRLGDARMGASMGWAVGLPILLDSLVRYAGDLDIVNEAWPTLVRYIDLVRSNYPRHDIPECLGDWIPAVESQKANACMSALAHWHQFVLLTAKFARLTGRQDAAAKYSALAVEIASCFRDRFVKCGGVCNNSQGDLLFGLYHGFLNPSERVTAYNCLKLDIANRNYSLTTGIFATKYLLEYLSTNGDAEIAGRVVTHEGYPGWYAMLARGATTLCEHWSEQECREVHSNCHPMFGSVDEWLIQHVLGIAVCSDAVGCNKVKIRPNPVAGVTSASGWMDTPHGRIVVSWRLEGTKLNIEKSLPQGIEERIGGDRPCGRTEKNGEE